jgi:hypothetical protein
MMSVLIPMYYYDSRTDPAMEEWKQNILLPSPDPQRSAIWVTVLFIVGVA